MVLHTWVCFGVFFLSSAIILLALKNNRNKIVSLFTSIYVTLVMWIFIEMCVFIKQTYFAPKIINLPVFQSSVKVIKGDTVINKVEQNYQYYSYHLIPSQVSQVNISFGDYRQLPIQPIVVQEG
jgi:hypothetical protein